MKAISTGVSDQLAAVRRRPVNLFILDLGSGVTLRYAASKQSVTFPSGGNTYTAKAVTYNPIETSAEGIVGRIEVRFDNTIKDMAAYANYRSFKGRSLEIWKIYRDASASTDYEVLFTGRTEEPFFDYNWMGVPAVAGIQLEKRYPTRSYGRLCAWKFGGTECNTDSLADLTSSTLNTSSTTVRGGTTYLFDTMLKNSSASEWVHGRLTCYVSGSSEERIVTDFETDSSGGTVTFDVPCSTNISASTKYNLVMGCPKTWVACSGASAWGPTGDNSNNYSGFLHVAKKSDKDLGV